MTVLPSASNDTGFDATFTKFWAEFELKTTVVGPTRVLEVLVELKNAYESEKAVNQGPTAINNSLRSLQPSTSTSMVTNGNRKADVSVPEVKDDGVDNRLSKIERNITQILSFLRPQGFKENSNR